MRGKRTRGRGGSPGPANASAMGSGGGEDSQTVGKRLTGRSSRLCLREWATNGLGVESCGKVFMPLGSSGGTREGAFRKEERTL